MELFLPRDFNVKQMSVGELHILHYGIIHTHTRAYREIASLNLPNNGTRNGWAGVGGADRSDRSPEPEESG